VATSLYYWNDASNLGSAGVYVVCPVVRDQTTSSNGPNAYIDVNDPAVDCELRITDEYGSSTIATGTAAPVNVAPNVYRLDIQNVLPQVSQGAYVITCYLPAGASVLRYSVAEP
jgi:hypothetical protein